MNGNLTLFKIVSSLLLMIGLLAPVKAAQSASSDTSSAHETSNKQETLKDEKVTKDHGQAGVTTQKLLSKKAQQIEFYSFLGIIGCSILIPEFLHNAKKDRQKAQKNSQKTETAAPSLEVIYNNNQEKIQLENQSESDREAA